MQIGFPYLAITRKDRALVGKKDPETRIYRRAGSEDDSGAWFDGLCDRFPDEDFVSPGGVSMYVPVSRAAVYKRINAGNLTAFCFHPTKWRRTLFGGKRKARETPYMYIAASECRAWAEELKARLGRSDDPWWLPDKEYDAEQEKLDRWPKPKREAGKPKWKRKKLLAGKSSTKGLLSLFF